MQLSEVMAWMFGIGIVAAMFVLARKSFVAGKGRKRERDDAKKSLETLQKEEKIPFDKRFEALTLKRDATEKRKNKEQVSPSVTDKRPAALTVYRDEIPDTEHIDTDCFAFFKGARVLLVEDNPINQKIVQKVLRHSGILLDIAENGKKALEKLYDEGERYDLVLMDISMPEMDGFETTRKIRGDRRFDTMPIVTFTAFNLGPEIEKMFSLGANAYLTKPLNIHKLYTVFSLFIGNVNRGLSLEKMLEIQGLNVRKGLENTEENEAIYHELLQQFVYKYARLPELFSEWVERGDYDRIALECKMLQEDLEAIGAEETAQYVHEIRRHFIYHTEELLSKHRLLFRTKLQALLDTIGVYLDAVRKRTTASQNERNPQALHSDDGKGNVATATGRKAEEGLFSNRTEYSAS